MTRLQGKGRSATMALLCAARDFQLLSLGLSEKPGAVVVNKISTKLVHTGFLNHGC